MAGLIRSEPPVQQTHPGDAGHDGAVLGLQLNPEALPAAVLSSEPEPVLVALDEPGRLLELVRERVTASVVLQRHVPIDGRRGVRVIARRAPSGRGEVSWVYEFDEGVDATDTDVLTAATAALAAARDEVGTL